MTDKHSQYSDVRDVFQIYNVVDGYPLYLSDDDNDNDGDHNVFHLRSFIPSLFAFSVHLLYKNLIFAVC